MQLDQKGLKLSLALRVLGTSCAIIWTMIDHFSLIQECAVSMQDINNN
jgi:hypothetical protein